MVIPFGQRIIKQPPQGINCCPNNTRRKSSQRLDVSIHMVQMKLAETFDSGSKKEIFKPEQPAPPRSNRVF